MTDHERPPDPWSTPATRRRFLRSLVALAAAPLAAAVVVLGRARDRRDRPRSLVVPVPTADGVTFHGDALVVRSGGAVRVFSARCPHLGCRIGRLEGRTLVCPCHGSRFGLDGSIERGPAARALTPLVVRDGEQPGTLEITLAV